ILLVRAFDRTGFFIHQTTKVRIRKFLDKGIEVYTYSKDGKLGFIPYCNLVTNIDNLYEGKSLYIDRKSTRLNSSHVSISYAVFCLKNKTPIQWSHEASILVNRLVSRLGKLLHGRHN